MNVLVPGGAGYIGAWLVPHLLADGHEVTVYDTMWFGNGFLPADNEHLTIIRGDVRNTEWFMDACEGQEAIIYLASLSNNAMHERDAVLFDQVNVDSFKPVVAAAREAGVKRFIYASSVAAYGSTEEDAKEMHKLEPSTAYGRAKEACETFLLSHYYEDFICTVTRSASVCGYSPHQRLDLTVNMMVHGAMRRGVVKVNGGEQKRCHIHINDICRAYRMLLDVDSSRIRGKPFNFVAQNLSVLDTAKIVAEETGARIEVGPATDDRSYTCDGKRAHEALGFRARKTVRDAVRDLRVKFDSGYWSDSVTNPIYQNLAEGLS